MYKAIKHVLKKSYILNVSHMYITCIKLLSKHIVVFHFGVSCFSLLVGGNCFLLISYSITVNSSSTWSALSWHWQINFTVDQGRRSTSRRFGHMKPFCRPLIYCRLLSSSRWLRVERSPSNKVKVETNWNFMHKKSLHLFHRKTMAYTDSKQFCHWLSIIREPRT